MIHGNRLPGCDTPAILAALSRPDSAAGLSRRGFLIGSLAAAGTLALPALSASASPATGSAGDGQGTLVLLQLAGGVDGLNVVIPLDDGNYAQARGQHALATTAIEVGGGFGFHPSLAGLAARYQGGQVAVVRGVGYPNADLSHFNSMYNWMTGTPGVESTTGWLGRWLDSQGGGDAGLTAVSIGSGGVPLHLVGATTQATSLPTSLTNAFGVVGTDNVMFTQLYTDLNRLAAGPTGLGAWGDALAGTMALATDQSGVVAPLYSPALPSDSVVAALTLAARLINADLGIRVLALSIGSFDTHQNEAGTLSALLSHLDAGLTAFYATLSTEAAGRTVVATWSEFGRRVRFNASNGTDHGTASDVLVMGAAVNGGMVDNQPSLAPSALDANGNLVMTTDFRQVYATLIDGWLGGDAASVLPGAPVSALETLPLLSRGPVGSAGAAPTTTPWGPMPTLHITTSAGDGGGALAASAAATPAGYWIVGAAGQVLGYGRAGTSVALPAGAPVVDMAVTPSEQGYWLARTSGAVVASGDAPSLGPGPSGHRVVAIASTGTGGGYWLVSSDGGVFSYGDAEFHGSAGHLRLVRPIVGAAATPSGQGYWLVASDGGIFTFGDAGFHGSLGGERLSRPIVGIAASPTGQGYWLVASDGGIFAFGDAGFHGRLGGERLSRPIVGLARSASGGGYWLVASDGGVFAFGDAGFAGSSAAHPPAGGAVAIAS
jgi:uncharacterized protein (DUF1501 family)